MEKQVLKREKEITMNGFIITRIERNKMESETIKTGNYYIEREGENIKITLIDPKHRNIAIIPSSGNAIIIKPESTGETQFKTK